MADFIRYKLIPLNAPPGTGPSLFPEILAGSRTWSEKSGFYLLLGFYPH